MYKIYLCGYISGEKIQECSDWRKQIRDYFYKNPKWHNKICFLDPLCGKDLKSISLDGNKSEIPGRAFMLRDYHGVKEANLIIANLDVFGGKRPLIGSLYELAWAFQDHKPVIVIGTDKHYIDHPFVQETAVLIVPTVEELLKNKVITYYFRGAVSAYE